MFKRILAKTVLGLFTLFITFDICYAIQLLSSEEALIHALGKDAKIKTESLELKEPQLSKVLARLGGSLVYTEKSITQNSYSGSNSNPNTVTFHYSIKEGEKSRVAIFDTETGKWGPIQFIIALNLDGTVAKVFVMNFDEQRGYPIARSSFMRQFEGKDLAGVSKDITGISGATVSSKSAVFAVKKAIVLYNVMVLNK
jgi:Na+-translocating ferredoxin:NAD+ oxidoreductase RnfG subunit